MITKSVLGRLLLTCLCFTILSEQEESRINDINNIANGGINVIQQRFLYSL